MHACMHVCVCVCVCVFVCAFVCVFAQAGSRALAQHIVRDRSKKARRHRKSLSQEIPVEYLVGTGG